MGNRIHDRYDGQNSDISIVINSPKGMHNSDIIDMSETGMAVYSDIALQTGTKITLYITIKDEYIEVDSSVVYSNVFNNKKRIGIRFKSMTESAQKILKKYLHDLPSI